MLRESGQGIDLFQEETNVHVKVNTAKEDSFMCFYTMSTADNYLYMPDLKQR